MSAVPSRLRLFLPALLALVLPINACHARSEAPPDTKQITDLSYVKGGSDAQKLDLYIPPEPKGPLVVWIHGGGWRAGTKTNPPGLGLLKHGYCLASVEYRFSQEAIFPAQIEDCKAAIRWLRAHASEYGYDPKKVGVWGASAGGHLVALLGTTGEVKDFDKGENLDQSSAVQCVIDWFGPTDFPGYKAPSEPVDPEKKDSLLAQLFGGPVSEKLELATKASPVTWVTKQSAPTLIMQGTKDPLVPLEQSQELADKLKAAGVEAKLEIIEGAGHGGPEFTTPARLMMLFEFLQSHLSN